MWILSPYEIVLVVIVTLRENISSALIKRENQAVRPVRRDREVKKKKKVTIAPLYKSMLDLYLGLYACFSPDFEERCRRKKMVD